MTRDLRPFSHKLTSEDAVDIWLRSWKGEFQHRIAAIYDVNPGRVSEVLKERKHIGSKLVALAKLEGGA